MDTANKSELYGIAHSFKGTSLDLISRGGSESFVLDVGGGDRSLDLPNYVNLDIIRSPSMTDVLGDGHLLPFKDNSFDIILCEASIEHCKKPWLVADELYRVLKKGGYIYVDAAFMQPLHSYPNHYFNMTLSGVESLFEKFQRIKSGVQPYQMPSYTIMFLLSNYARCLFPFLDKKGENIQIFETGAFVGGKKNTTNFFVTFYKLAHSILSVFDRRIPKKNAARIAAGVYYLGQKN